MKNIFLLVSIMILFLSCNRDFYGTYTTNYSEDKSSFFQIRLNVDNTVEKTEVHTIRDFAKGKFIIKENEVNQRNEEFLNKINLKINNNNDNHLKESFSKQINSKIFHRHEQKLN